ncbi:MAG: protein phosphatase 2C domain-containing protein [Candidatus Eremiobacterota bacterium]
MRRYAIGHRTDVGRRRERNEDSLRVVDLGEGAYLLVVADGMGGLRGGQTASKVVAEYLSRAQWSAKESRDVLVDRIHRRLGEAHGKLVDKARESPDLSQMGTTVVVALLLPDGVLHQYTGDSRLYWFRGMQVLYRTNDHSVAQALADRNHLRQDQVASHPFSNQLYSYLGPNLSWASVKLEPSKGELLPVEPGDTIVACSDGLSGMVSEGDLTALVAEIEDPQDLADRLVEAALEAGGDDNVSVVVARVVA